MCSDNRAMWAAHADPFSAMVRRVESWQAPSPCDGWSAADVLDHVMETQREFFARHGVTMPVQEGSPPEQWAAHEAVVRDAVGDDAVMGAEFESPFGPLAVGDALRRFYGFDLIVHRWDLARSQGWDERLTDSEVDEVAAAVDGFGEMAYAPGIFAGPLTAPEGADAQTVVLAKVGRIA